MSNYFAVSKSGKKLLIYADADKSINAIGHLFARRQSENGANKNYLLPLNVDSKSQMDKGNIWLLWNTENLGNAS